MNSRRIRKVNYLAFLILLVIFLFTIGCSGQNWTSVKNIGKITGTAYGTVTDTKNNSLENAKVSLIGTLNYTTITDKNGNYNFTNIPDGMYFLVVEKTGHRSNEKNMLALLVYEGGENNLNVTLYKDCDYYTPDTSVNYVVRYGYNATLYRGDATFILPYPEGAAYTVYPDVKKGLSEISTVYKTGNRMLRWTLNNSDGQYSSVQGNMQVDLKGTKTMHLLERNEMKISDAALSQKKYLGKEVYDEEEKRIMIDPTDPEIKALAEQIKSETESDDVWTVANALYVWVKTNIAYHTDRKSDYVQSATEVLHNRRGDCDEISFLYISLCRAVGIPARFVIGYWVSNKPEGDYVGHAWAEFYYGAWAPVELTELWSSDNTAAKVADPFMVNRDNALFFGIDRPDHITSLVDDGTITSLGDDRIISNYYDRSLSYSSYTYYEAEEYNQMYIAYCKDGTRKIVKEME